MEVTNQTIIAATRNAHRTPSSSTATSHAIETVSLALPWIIVNHVARTLVNSLFFTIGFPSARQTVHARPREADLLMSHLAISNWLSMPSLNVLDQTAMPGLVDGMEMTTIMLAWLFTLAASLVVAALLCHFLANHTCQFSVKRCTRNVMIIPVGTLFGNGNGIDATDAIQEIITAIRNALLMIIIIAVPITDTETMIHLPRKAQQN